MTGHTNPNPSQTDNREGRRAPWRSRIAGKACACRPSRNWIAIRANTSGSPEIARDDIIWKTERLSAVRRRRGERGIWRRRFWEHGIRDDDDYAAHLDYVHFNPVKHGYVDDVRAWPYSTFNVSVRRGMYAADWAGGGNDVAEAGEAAWGASGDAEP